MNTNGAKIEATFFGQIGEYCPAITGFASMAAA
jgi:hypothetical protein